MTIENFYVAYMVYDLFCIGSETVLTLPTISFLPCFQTEFDDGNVVIKSLIDVPKGKIISYSALSLTKSLEDSMMYNIYPIDGEFAFGNNLHHAVGIDMESLESLVTPEKLNLLNTLNNL